MKRSLVSLAVLSAALVSTSLFAQGFPKGNYAFEPGSRGSDGKVSHFIIQWQDAQMIAYADSKGSVTNMFLTFMEKLNDGKFHMPEVPERFHDFPSKDKKHAFKDLQKWKTFAEKQMKRVVAIDGTKSADLQAWQCTDSTTISVGFEGQAANKSRAYVFKGENQVMILPDRNWLGEKPPFGSVFLGKFDDEEVFFPVTFLGGKPSIDPATAKILANREKTAETPNAKK
ncbi:MAG: hypothetical protein Q7S86_01645 [bacterium]|nr:hypothetical protein [bacterium]